jgi:ATP-binding protein involved in chromosome partitioning
MSTPAGPGHGRDHPIRTYHDVADPGAEGVVAQIRDQGRRLSDRLDRIGAVVAVASGKGGVGKSAVTANLAAVLAGRGRAVGAADADLHGPTLARMLGAARERLSVDEDGVHPARGILDVRLMSMDLLLGSADAPVRWRGPDEGGFAWHGTLEAGALREFLADTAWGDLDLLLLDLPPGTDRLDRMLGILPRLDGLLLVTTPSEAAREAGVRVTGLVANMTAWRCPGCGRETRLYEADAAERLVTDTGLSRWADVPFDPRLAVATDGGRPFAIVDPDAPASRAFRELADRLEEEVGPLA